MSSPGPEKLSPTATATRLAAIGAILAALALAFLYTGGWLSPDRLTQSRIMARFDAVDGKHPGFRRNHAKGVCVTGWFDSSGNAAALSKAAVFKPGHIPVIGRFALAGGLPFVADEPAMVRSLALRFLPTGAEEWRTGMIDIPVFVVSSVQGFYDLLAASAPDAATGKPDPAKMGAFFAAHPEALPAITAVGKRPGTSGFADATYNALNAFYFVSEAGASTPVRWSAVPLQAVAPVPATPPAGKDYLFDDLIGQIENHKLQWKLMVAVGEPGDSISDPTQAWPPGRKQVDAGTVTLDKISSEADGLCTAVNFDPMVLPDGIAPSDDPFLSARSAAYAKSFTLRAGEAAEKPPSEITPHMVQSGGKS